MKTTIGASEIAAVLGLSPYTSPFAFWMQATGRTPRDEGNEATEWGIALEEGVLRQFEKRHDVRLERPVSTMVHPKHPWMRATPDALLTRDGCTHAFATRHDIDADEVITIDAKTAALTADVPRHLMAERWGAPWTDDVPVEYAAQLQQQMLVTEAVRGRPCRRGIIAALIAGRGGVDFMVPGVPSFQQLIVEKGSAFVFENLELDIAPDPQTGDDWEQAGRDLWQRKPREGKPRRDAVDDEAALIVEYHEVKRAEKVAEERAKEIRARIIKAIGDGYAIETEAFRATLTEGSETPKTKASAVVADLDTIPMPPDVRQAIAALIKQHTTPGWSGRSLRVTEKKVKT